MNDTDNYRAITLLSVITEVLQGVILSLHVNVLDIDNFQFVFKCGIGCPDASFALKSVINHFVAKGSSILIASLDVSKPFDRVNHFKLFNYLINDGVPIAVVEVLRSWCAKMFVVIWWNNSLSHMFSVESGIFMSVFIVNLRLLDVGCHVNHQFLCCIQITLL